MSNISQPAEGDLEKCEIRDGMDAGRPKIKTIRKIMRAQFLPRDILKARRMIMA